MNYRKLKESLRLLGIVALLTGATYAMVGFAHQARMAQHPMHGRISVEQLNDRIAAVHRALIVPDAAVQQIAEPEMLCAHNGTPYPVWEVEWRDKRGENLVHTAWNAETGELVQAQRPAQHPVKGAPSDRSAAVRACWRWMNRLEVARYAGCWHLVGPPRSDAVDWVLVWQASGHLATAMIDRQTYQLDSLVIDRRNSGD